MIKDRPTDRPTDVDPGLSSVRDRWLTPKRRRLRSQRVKDTPRTHCKSVASGANLILSYGLIPSGLNI